MRLNQNRPEETTSGATPMDGVNRRTWAKPDTVGYLAAGQKLTDTGEGVVFVKLAQEFTDQPILDIGVGAGRTTPFLRAISTDYVAVDYTPEFVEAFRRRFPDIRVHEADARKLSAFEDESFGLVFFSFNGIGAVDHEDRMKILREAHRVLKPGGVFCFSNHIQDGPDAIQTMPDEVIPFSLNPLRLGVRVARHLRTAAIRHVNRFRLRRREVHGERYSILNIAAHDFGLMVYFVTIPEQRRQLQEVGFDPRSLFYDTGGALITDDTGAHSAWFHVLARKL